MYDYMDFYDSVVKFGRIVGGGGIQCSNSDIYNQIKLVEEETKELCDELTGTTETDITPELLKESIDVLYVVTGLLIKLKARGVQVETALQMVCENNLDKFIEANEDFTDTIIGNSLKYYAEQDVSVYAKLNAIDGYWSILDSNQKLRKPFGYSKVDLTECMFKKVNDE